MVSELIFLGSTNEEETSGRKGLQLLHHGKDHYWDGVVFVVGFHDLVAQPRYACEHSTRNKVLVWLRVK